MLLLNAFVLSVSTLMALVPMLVSTLKVMLTVLTMSMSILVSSMSWSATMTLPATVTVLVAPQ